MRPSSLLVFLLVLHLMLCGAYGARLGKFDTKSTDASDQLTNVEIEYTVEKLDYQNNDNLHKREIIEVKCEDDNEGHCSTKGKNRKLITSTTMPTSIAKPIQENLENGEKKMKAHPKLSSSSSSSHHHNDPSTGFRVDKHKEITPPEYENAMDMTVMDYSPAKRKPPIHN
ncbi:uncharacterized protein LOC104901845 [Beta vulgaris subsp. vulgaris]|uniref:uncharacterized protein LOC104901845 n=1 Tax=Beta vulgaris subsp. vulgaris TaxID=3555 RepID=UPI0020375E39|nr:uncharacterized protein LOC104901845 [Beta vulgaris subsp. vulgaris]